MNIYQIKLIFKKNYNIIFKKERQKNITPG